MPVSARLVAPIALGALLLSAAVPAAAADCPERALMFRRGDANVDGASDLSDPIALLDFLFLGGDRPSCLKSADFNDDLQLDVTDAVFLLEHLFLGGAAPPEPFAACGPRPAIDLLGCAAYPPCEFEEIATAYCHLRTIAGRGLVRQNGTNSWEDSFEGAPAATVELSRPHMAMADDAGNIYIADKDAHAIRKVTPAGILTTVAGINQPGDDGDEPGPAAARRLNQPNGLWTRADGTVYILDTGNGKVRRMGTDGVLITLFDVPGGIGAGRGLWVGDDEQLAFVSTGTEVKSWTPADGVETIADGFIELGNLVVDPGGDLVITDRGGHRVYRISSGGPAVPIAGNGRPDGGGSGFPALETGLFGVRAVWFRPNGGYFLGTHEGSQVWYIDTRGIAHLFLDGFPDHSHTGDGQYFRTPGFKISELRAITADRLGNLIITENDHGFIRMVERQ